MDGLTFSANRSADFEFLRVVGGRLAVRPRRNQMAALSEVIYLEWDCALGTTSIW